MSLLGPEGESVRNCIVQSSMTVAASVTPRSRGFLEEACELFEFIQMGDVARE